MPTSREELALLANLLYIASHGRQGAETAERLMRRFGSLGNIFGSSPGALARLGLPEAQAALLLAAHPVARRRAMERLGPSPNLRDPEALRDYVRALYVGVRNERFIVINLDDKGRLIDAPAVAEGTMREIPLLPRTLLDRVVRAGASSVIFVHNHPGGQRGFSSSDILSTQAFAAVLRSAGVALLDHILFSGGETVSMRAACRLPEIFAPPR
ncbi:MAG: JAB domain-containing protein [Clostridia bacterium]|nr:JAB domain-containing protein [Clostridia bacterium]